MEVTIDEFVRQTNGFHYVYDKVIADNSIVILKAPPVSPNKRGINDIGWQCDNDDIVLYGTLASDIENTELWELINPSFEVNKTISAFKIVNNSGESGHIIIRMILN